MIKTCNCGGLYATERETFAGTPCYCPFPFTVESKPFTWGARDPSKRDFLRLAGTGVAGMAVGSIVGCGGKSVSGTVMLITGAISELKLLYPNLPALDKIVKLATDFNTDWVAGKFDSARTFFESLDTTVLQVMNDLEVNASPRAKLLLSTIGIAVRVIASLIAEQGQAAGPQAIRAAGKTADRINQLSNAAEADWILRAVRH